MCKVLIVEDNRDIQELYRDLLSDYTLHAALSCEEARALLDELTFDVLVLDIDLPDGYGPELLDEYPDILSGVIVASGRELAAKDRATLYDRGVSVILSKPFDPTEFRAAMRKAARCSSAQFFRALVEDASEHLRDELQRANKRATELLERAKDGKRISQAG